MNYLERFRGRMRGFQLPERRANRGPTEVPRSPELETRHHMRASNERLDRSGRHALTRPPPGRTRHGSDKETQTPDEAVEAAPKGADSPSKAEGYSQTPAPEAKATAATLIYDRSYSQIHPALQQIPAHSTLELCLWLVSSRQGYIIWTVK